MAKLLSLSIIGKHAYDIRSTKRTRLKTEYHYKEGEKNGTKGINYYSFLQLCLY